MAILAIDQGTSGTKAIVLDRDNTIIGLAEMPLRPDYLPQGGVQQDPAALLESVLEAGRRAVAAAGEPVSAVTLTNQGETVLAWDRATGRALSPAIVWQDRRSQALCRAMAADAEWIASRTGLRLDPYFSAPKMAWIRQNLTTEGIVTTTDAWLVCQLTGELVTDASTASRSLLLDVDRLTWDPELLSAFGVADKELPRIVASDEIVGVTDAFGAEVPVTGLIVDQQAALFAQGCLETGSAKCTYGTGAFVLANAGTDLPTHTAGLATSIAWRARSGRHYCVDGQVYAAASAVRWITELGLGDDVTRVDEAVAESSEGTMFVPALAGLGAPWWKPEATATLSGLTLGTHRGNVLRAVLEGIAAQVCSVLETVSSSVSTPLNAVRADGGLTRSRVLMQAQADLCQVPVEVYPSPHATALGSAAMGRLGMEPALGLADAVPAWTPAAVFEPQWSADRAASFMTRWHEALSRSFEATGGGFDAK
jgi:glycerol kinase